MARIVVPGVPHHVTQRGNRRADVFEADKDREASRSCRDMFGKVDFSHARLMNRTCGQRWEIQGQTPVNSAITVILHAICLPNTIRFARNASHYALRTAHFALSLEWNARAYIYRGTYWE